MGGSVGGGVGAGVGGCVGGGASSAADTARGGGEWRAKDGRGEGSGRDYVPAGYGDITALLRKHPRGKQKERARDVSYVSLWDQMCLGHIPGMRACLT